MKTVSFEQAKELADNFCALDKNDLFTSCCYSAEDMPEGEYTLSDFHTNVTGNWLLEHVSGWHMPLRAR